MLMNHAKTVYFNLNENDRFRNEVPYRELRFVNDMKSRYPAHSVERSAPLLAALRAIKNDIEIKLMQKAIDITEKAFRRVLRFVKPGVMEHEIEAEIIHEFIRKRANGHAYTPIIASGSSACILHYNENNKECKDGEVILLDFGAEYANYAADLSRSIPVNGLFTDRQRDVYNAVLRVMRQATKMLVPGNTIEQYHVEVGKIMEHELIGYTVFNQFPYRSP
jgi:Xaa-Pro aminopeptidase